MEFFKKYFHDVNFEENRGEVKVLCPFHSDTKPSATVNTDKSLFHCWVCGKGHNEEQFMAEVKGITVQQAYRLMSEIQNENDLDWEISHKAELWADSEVLQATKDLGLSNEFIDSMGLGMAYVKDVKTLAIPVFFEKTLVDVRRYNVLKQKGIPKVTGNQGAKSGWVIPYDDWVHCDEETYIFEGEKDMLMAQSLGLNAITLTGGAGALPNEYMIPAFKDKIVHICYDNDDAGRDGANKLAYTLSDVCKSVGILNIGDLVTNDKEDFYDYVMKYGGDVFEFLALPSEPYIKPEVKVEFTTIRSAMNSNKVRSKMVSLVTVTSEFADAYSVPSVIVAEKFESDYNNDMMPIGQKLYWTLENYNIHEMLSLIEVDAKNHNVHKRAYELTKVPNKEKGIRISFKDEKLVYKSVITDKDVDGSTTTVDLYSFEKLVVGNQYQIEFRLFAHPNKNQRIVAIATHVKKLDDVSMFNPNPNLLSQLQLAGSIKERVDMLYQSAKHHVAKHMDFNIWFMSDLVFNSVLNFEYGEYMRGALDVFILGDTQVGKSETTSKLVDLYNFGHFISLKTSTTVGLIGGSNKIEGSWANTIGAIPRQHKRLAVLEEFSGADPSFIKTMTDIRSSGKLRLNRASGELITPCVLRMITISNPINDERGSPRFLSSFPNGIIPIMELIKSAEDVTRYDAFLLTPKREGRFNPFGMKLVGEPIPKEVYEHKAQWVVSRRPEHVVFDEGVESYIWEKAEELNELFECNIPIFGTTTSKKLARFAVALASLIVNTDETYEKVIVTQEIVDYMVSFLKDIYTADQVKLDVVKKEWESYSKYTDVELKKLEELYPANTVMVEFLANQSKTTRSNLQAVTGKNRDEFSTVFNKLVQMKAVRLDMENVYPTEKFRKMYQVMSKTTGEMVEKHTVKVEYDL